MDNDEHFFHLNLPTCIQIKKGNSPKVKSKVPIEEIAILTLYILNNLGRKEYRNNNGENCKYL